MKRVLKDLDLYSWDKWVPLTVIAAFVGLGLLVGFGGITFPGTRQAGRIETLYIEIGIGATSGIFAIIVSLSLVAIQFASQEYSHRIMTLYIKSVMFWSTISVYLGLIVAAILLEATLTESQSPRFAGVVVVGSLLAFALLVPHFIVTAAFLRPEFIIGKLLRRVDTAYLREADQALNRGRLDSQQDRLLPVVEIVERSLNRGDLSTTRAAMQRLHTTYVTQAEQLNSPLVEQYFLDYLLRIGTKAVSSSEAEEAAVYAVQLIGTVGSQGPAGALAVEDIHDLGFAALKEDAEPVVHQMIDSLRQIFERTGLAEAKKAVLDSYRDLIDDLAATEERRLLRHLSTNLAQIAQAALLQGDLDTGYRCLDQLESVGHDAGTHNLAEVVLHVVKLLQGLGVAAATEDAATAERVVRTVLRIERAVRPSEREVIAATEFARGDIERAVRRREVRVVSAAQPPAPPVPQEPEAGDGGDFSDLWGERKD